MKTYKTPTLTDINLGVAEIDGEKYEVVGIVPFLAAAAGAAVAVAKAVEAFDDKYQYIQHIEPVGKVK